jgi:hypothetical protein
MLAFLMNICYLGLTAPARRNVINTSLATSSRIAVTLEGQETASYGSGFTKSAKETCMG